MNTLVRDPTMPGSAAWAAEPSGERPLRVVDRVGEVRPVRSSRFMWLRGGHWHYAWIVVAVTFVTLLISGGVQAALGVLIRPLEAEFGWGRASISLAIGVGFLVYG